MILIKKIIATKKYNNNPELKKEDFLDLDNAKRWFTEIAENNGKQVEKLATRENNLSNDNVQMYKILRYWSRKLYNGSIYI